MILRNSAKVPTTSAPSIQSFVECFEKSLEIAESVLCITVSCKFSSSLDVARLAADYLRQRIGNNDAITVLDSGTASGAEGLIATEALRRAASGLNIDEVSQFSQKIAQKVSLLAFPETLYYIWKSGRVPRIAHIGSSILDIKPIFEMKHGKVGSVARVRSRTRAIQRLVDMVCAKSSNPIHFTVIHADCKNDAENLLRMLHEKCDVKESFVSEFTPAMGSHIGPGLLGVAFWHE